MLKASGLWASGWGVAVRALFLGGSSPRRSGASGSPRGFPTSPSDARDPSHSPPDDTPSRPGPHGAPGLPPSPQGTAVVALHFALRKFIRGFDKSPLFSKGCRRGDVLVRRSIASTQTCGEQKRQRQRTRGGVCKRPFGGGWLVGGAYLQQHSSEPCRPQHGMDGSVGVVDGRVAGIDSKRKMTIQEFQGVLAGVPCQLYGEDCMLSRKSLRVFHAVTRLTILPIVLSARLLGVLQHLDHTRKNRQAWQAA
jgi:hypothetical protein